MTGRVFVDPFDVRRQPLRPLAGDNGSYLPGPAEVEGPYDEGELVDDRYEQRAEDDRIGERYGHEPGARRSLA